MPQSYSPVYFPADWSIASMGANNTGVDVCNDVANQAVTLSACLDPLRAINQGNAATYSQNNLRVSGNTGHVTVRTNTLTDGSSKYVFEVTIVKHDPNVKIGASLPGDVISGGEQLGTNSSTGQGWGFISDNGDAIYHDNDTSAMSSNTAIVDGDMYHLELNNTTGDVFVWRKAYGGSWAAENSGSSVTSGSGKTALAGAKVHLAGHLYQASGTNLMQFNFAGPFEYPASATYVPFTQTVTGIGNYATLNPHATNGNGTVSRGNLNFTVGSTSNSVAGSTIGVSSGKFYGEVTYNANAGGAASFGFGIASSTSAVLRKGSGNYLGQGSDSHGINATNGNLTSNGSVTVSSYAGGALVDGTTYMWCLDMDNGKWWAGNAETNTWFTNSGVGNPATGANAGVTGLDGIIQICASAYNGDGVDMNFGQTPLVNQANIPSGFKTLKTTNLPTPSVKNVDDGYIQVLDTGANIQSALATARSGYSTYMEVFKDLDSTTIWQVRFSDDTSNGLDFESTAAKTSFAAPSGSNNFLGWAFNMNATHGMFTAEVSHSNGSDTNTAHSLGAGLKMAVVKITNTTGGWYWSHPGMTSGHNIEWNQHTNGEQNGTVYAGIDDTNVIVKSAAPTGTYRVIAIVEVAGFSSLATMVGNGANDGPFVYTGMQPEFMVCRRHTGGVNTFAYVPQGQNPENTLLEFDDPGGTSTITGGSKDFCATGFKVPETSNDFNASGVRNFIWSIGRVTGGTGVAQAKAR